MGVQGRHLSSQSQMDWLKAEETCVRVKQRHDPSRRCSLAKLGVPAAEDTRRYRVVCTGNILPSPLGKCVDWPRKKATI